MQTSSSYNYAQYYIAAGECPALVAIKALDMLEDRHGPMQLFVRGKTCEEKEPLAASCQELDCSAARSDGAIARPSLSWRESGGELFGHQRRLVRRRTCKAVPERIQPRALLPVERSRAGRPS
jgi:hypothetical protein